MGLVYAEIKLINGDDLALVRRKVMDEDEVKRMRVSALVDTGSLMLAINENIQEQLQLAVVEIRKSANGRWKYAIPLEDMDVLIHPQRQELIVNPDHAYFAQMKMK